MTIGGGTFTRQDKVLPGAYINVVSSRAGAFIGTRGVASLPLVLSWGEEGKMIRIEASEFAKKAFTLFGYDATDPKLIFIREALKRAKTLLVYRLNTGAKATKTIGGVTVTAKYSGIRGNDIRVAVLTNTGGGFDVVTYLGHIEVDKQIGITAPNKLKANNFVTFGDTGTLQAAVATQLAGGTDGTADGTAYANYLTVLEKESFNTFGYIGTDASTKSLFANFAKRMREEEGKKVVCVLTNQPADYEGVINVKNGVILEDGTVVSHEKVIAWVVGATAAAEVNESLTNVAYDGAVDVDIKYTNSEYEAAIKAGQFVFYHDGEKARVLSDINSLTTFTDKSEDLTSNRVMRVLDGWANDVANTFGKMYVGITTNDETGRQLLKADLVSLGLQYQSLGAISNFDSTDIEVVQGEGKRDVVINCALQPNDSMEKLYMTVNVS